MAKRELKTQKIEETIVEETPVIEPVEEIVEEKAIIPIGVVSKCSKLNIRKKPNAKADVVKVLDANTEVTIDPHYTDKDWYKVTAEDGTVGYCMKDFMVIK